MLALLLKKPAFREILASVTTTQIMQGLVSGYNKRGLHSTRTKGGVFMVDIAIQIGKSVSYLLKNPELNGNFAGRSESVSMDRNMEVKLGLLLLSMFMDETVGVGLTNRNREYIRVWRQRLFGDSDKNRRTPTKYSNQYFQFEQLPVPHQNWYATPVSLGLNGSMGANIIKEAISTSQSILNSTRLNRKDWFIAFGEHANVFAESRVEGSGVKMASQWLLYPVRIVLHTLGIAKASKPVEYVSKAELVLQGTGNLPSSMLRRLDRLYNRRYKIPKLLPMVTPPDPWKVSPKKEKSFSARIDLNRAVNSAEPLVEVAASGYRHYPMLYLKSLEEFRLNKKQPWIRSGRKRGNDVSGVNAVSPLILEGLNYLSGTSWKVNRQMLSVLTDPYSTVPLERHSSVGAACKPIDKELRPSISRNISSKVLRDLLLNGNISDLSTNLPINALQSVRIALFLRNESFYFPHSIDFRGRAYPAPQSLNHMSGGDIGRSLLMFGRGKPLGEHGLKYLKLHLANLYGNNGLSGPHGNTVEEKVFFIDNNIENILLSARDPWGLSESVPWSDVGTVRSYRRNPGLMWWMGAAQPFQALACCMELKNALESDSPSTYVSHIPVHQDGSCNGLQHYAALAKSVPEGFAVNLLSKGDFLSNYSVEKQMDIDNRVEAPQDVYASVLKLLKKRLRNLARQETSNDAYLLSAGSLKNDTSFLLQKSPGAVANLLLNLNIRRGDVSSRVGNPDLLLEPLLNRKLVKKSVMTHISYGLTMNGAILQLFKNLKSTLMKSAIVLKLPAIHPKHHRYIPVVHALSEDTSINRNLMMLNHTAVKVERSHCVQLHDEDISKLASHLAVILVGCIDDKYIAARKIRQSLSNFAAVAARSDYGNGNDERAGAVRARNIKWQTPIINFTVVQRPPQYYSRQIMPHRIKEFRQRVKSRIGTNRPLSWFRWGCSGGHRFRNLFRFYKCTENATEKTKRPHEAPNKTVKKLNSSFIKKNEYFVRKQKSAFPPNFIHSLDSTHMFLTCLGMKNTEDGLPFCGIHDSFWTVPGAAFDMSRILRTAFVDMHEAYRNGTNMFNMRNNSIDLQFQLFRNRTTSIDTGKLDLHSVLHSKYFFQ